MVSRRRFGAGLAAVGAAAVAGAALTRDDAAVNRTAADAPAEPTPTTSPTSPPTTGAATPTTEPAGAPPDLGPAPDVVDLDGWLNTTATSFDDFGGVRVVQFWTFGCFNCTNTLPHLQALYAAEAPRGLEIIGLHAPEFDREADPDNVAAALVDLGVTWPVGLDTDKTNFRSWQGSRRFWPRTYVLDADDRLRFDHIGEGAYEELAATVDWLLTNPT